MKKLMMSLAVFGLLLGSLLPAQPVQAAWDKNNIIDNSLFIATSSMSVAEIQAFLDGQGSLLANWVDNVDMVKPDGCVAHKATGMTAAEVIHEAATAWNAQIVENCAGTDVSYWGDPDYSNYTMPTVSPKVLLATLQKEQSAVTANGGYSTDPADYTNVGCCSSNEYKLKWATGYAVPDSGDPNHKYMGFYNQINWASWQLRYNYERSAGNTAWDEVGYKVFTGPFIEGNWRRCATCAVEPFDGYYPIDGSPLYMENQATASLYYYTPHTYPGFFGNYNFVQFYEQWFGTTHGADYKWELVSQHSWTDDSKTQARSIQDLVPGDRVYIGFVAKNTGAVTWNNSGLGAVWAGTEGPRDRDSQFCDSTWLNCKRPGRLIETSVDPGQNGTFEFWYKVPENFSPGTFQERFSLVASGVTWFNDYGMNFYTVVQAPQRTWQLVSQHSWTDDSKTQTRSIQDLAPGDRIYIGFVAKNTGNVTWKNSGTGALWAGTVGPRDRNSDFCDSTWLNCRRPARMVEDSVAPGENGTFEFWYNVPHRQPVGATPERFSLVSAGVAWLNDYGMNFYTVVEPPQYSWELVSQHAYTDNTKTTARSIKNLNRGDRVYLSFVARNNGNLTWRNTGEGAVWAGTEGPKDRTSDFCDSTWLNCRRPARMSESVVKPGETATFDFWYEVPTDQPYGTYPERFNILLAGVSWLNDYGMNFYTVVEP